MNTYTYEKPIEWYIAKLDYLYNSISTLPDIRLGQRYNADVLRIHSSPRKFQIITRASKKWNETYNLCLKRTSLTTQFTSLSQELHAIYHTSYEKERHNYRIIKNTTNRFDMTFYNQLTNNACTFPKTHSYEFDGHNFRSRFEMATAQEIKNLHLDYKYDSGIQISTRTIYPDFALPFPEFNRFVILEDLGRLDDPIYINDNLEKLRDYFNNGILLDTDLYTLTGSEKSMPNNLQIRSKLISIINNLCAQYVIPIL